MEGAHFLPMHASNFTGQGGSSALLQTLSIPLTSKNPIYRRSMDETRYGGAFSGNVVLMCMIRGKCADLRAKVVEISGQLPLDKKSAEFPLTIASIFIRGLKCGRKVHIWRYLSIF